MTRAWFADTVIDPDGKPIRSVTVDVFNAGTTTPIAGTIYAAPSGGTTLSNPFLTNTEGELEFWLADPLRVDLRYSKTGEVTETHTVDVMAAEHLHSGTYVAYVTGLAGDGITDDTTVLQAAITAAASGATLLIPAGTFLVSQLTCNKRITFLGAGWEKTIFLAKTGSAGPILNFSHTGLIRYSEIGGFSVNMQNAPAVVAMYLRNLESGRIHDVFIHGNGVANGGTYGIQTSRTSNCFFDRIYCHDQATAGMSINGDLDTGSGGMGHRFADIIIKRTQAGTMVAGFELLRTSAQDVGGIYLENVRTNRNAGSMTYGFRFYNSVIDDGTAVAGIGPGQFIHMDRCVSDNVDGTAPIYFENIGQVRIEESYFSRSDATATGAMIIDGGHRIHCYDTYIGNVVFRSTLSAPKVLSFYDNTMENTATPMFTLDASAIAAPPTTFRFGNNYVSSGKAISNRVDIVSNQQDESNPLSSVKILTNSGGGRADTLVLSGPRVGNNAATMDKHVRVTPGGTLQIMDDAFTQNLLTLTDSGKLHPIQSVVLLTKAGAVTDADFPDAPAESAAQVDGLIALDTTNNRLYARIGGVWKYVGFPSYTAANDALAAHLAGVEAFTGIKTFTADPVFNAAAIPKTAVANLVADPLGLGIATNMIPPINSGAIAVASANDAHYFRCLGGASISKIAIHVGTQSGNISVAAYTNSGTGRNAAPTGGRIATSGAVACPSGYSEVSLGGTVTVNEGDWLAISADNTTATFRGADTGNTGSAIALGLHLAQPTAHPLPSTPASLTGVAGKTILLVGVT